MCWKKKAEKKEEKKDRDASLKLMAEKVESEVTRTYILEWAIKQRRWYADASRKAQTQYKRWMVCSYVISALIPVLTLMVDWTIWVKILITLLSSSVSFINAYLLLQNSRGQWLSYRKTSEMLVGTLLLYFNNAGMYAACADQAERDKLLIQTCQGIMSNENADWVSSLEQSGSNDSQK